jgi:hypothetical protein
MCCVSRLRLVVCITSLHQSKWSVKWSGHSNKWSSLLIYLTAGSTAQTLEIGIEAMIYLFISVPFWRLGP